jgi:glycosyltransferase involved in cell wall biosynthesis
MSIDSPGEGEPSVLICIPTLGSGGAERQVRLLAPRLVARGIGISLFSRLVPADAATLTAAGVACFPIAAAGNHNPLLAIELARAARTSGARIIHTWLTQMDVLGGAVALATRRRWILSERNSRAAYGGGAKDKARAWLGRHADVVVANSVSGLAVWPDHACGIVIDNGIDLEGIRNAPVTVADGGIGIAERTVIVSVARLAPGKRIDRLLHAISRLRRDIPDILLVLIGEGPEERALKRLAAELGIEGQVLFAGFRPDVWSWIKAGRVFVSASRFEGQPNAVLEAGVAGTPQVLSDIDMHRAAVGDGGALFVDPEDADALASAVLSLVGDPRLGARIAAAARDALRDFSAERAADLYACLYRRAATGTPLGAGAEAIRRSATA